jgi:anion-transporting  ArsA/GET3 family ATPase
MTTASLTPILDARRVILCVGCGGVGKTTVSAALSLAAAMRGKRVLCLTIDPAKRLANSLGLAQLKQTAQKIEPALFEPLGVAVPGSLTVMMLDTKSTFDELVARHASSAAARDRILNNRLYGYLSTGLAGTQSYMAMEKLLSVKEDPNYDLIVLDTPPTSNALDFLDAPNRLINALDSRAMRWFMQAFERSGRLSLNVLAKSVAVVMRAISRITGGGFLEQMSELIIDLNDLFGGFRERATRVAEAFRGPEFGYVLVTTPEPVAIQEVIFFADRLEQQGMRQDAFVVNRVHHAPRVSPSIEQIQASTDRLNLALGPAGPDRLQRALADEARRAELDDAHLASLAPFLSRRHSGRQLAPARVDIPALAQDVHDVRTLGIIARYLCP